MTNSRPIAELGHPIRGATVTFRPRLSPLSHVTLPHWLTPLISCTSPFPARVIHVTYTVQCSRQNKGLGLGARTYIRTDM